MPDREKVVKGLRDLRRYLEDKEWSDNRVERQTAKVYWQTVTDAINLLEEQEAVKPIPFFTETGAESPNYVICGHCKSIKAIMPKYTKQKYCHECGFPVLWECR